MAKHDIVLLNTTSSGFETDLGSNVARIKGDADDLFQVKNASGVDKFAVSSIDNSMIINGDLTLTGNLSSSLNSTASFGKIDAVIIGDASQMTNVNEVGHVSSSKQLAARISGAFTAGFEVTGNISGSATSTGSFTRVFANTYVGDGSQMTNVPVDTGTLSGSAQIASSVSGSFNKGFEFEGLISGSATSTGSFGRLDVLGSIDVADASQVTGVADALPSGIISSSIPIASQISGAFTSGFEITQDSVHGTGNVISHSAQPTGSATGSLISKGFFLSGSVTSTGSFGHFNMGDYGGFGTISILSSGSAGARADQTTHGGKITITDTSELTGLNTEGFISSSAQIAANISGAFQHGFGFGDAIGTTFINYPSPYNAETHPTASRNIISGSATSTGSFGRLDSISSITADASNTTGLSIPTGAVSSSKQLATQISGSFTSGFTVGGDISGSATSTGSFSRINFNTVSATDVSGITGHETGHLTGASGIASQISGAFQHGFGFAGGAISASTPSTLRIQHLELSGSFTFGSTNLIKNWDTSFIQSATYGTNLASAISGAFQSGFGFQGTISGSATSTGSFNKIKSQELFVKEMVGKRKPISGSMDHVSYASASYKSDFHGKISIPVRGRVDHTMITKQFTATGSMESQKYRNQPGQLFVDNWGRLNMTVQTGSMVAQPAAWTLVGSGEALSGRVGGMIAQSNKAALVLPGTPMPANCTRIFDGITVFGGPNLIRDQVHCGWSHAYQGIGNGVNDGLFAGGGFGGGMGRHGQCYNGSSWSMIVCLPQDVYSSNGQPKAFNAPGVTTGGGGALVGGTNRNKVYEWTGVSWEIGGTRNVNIGGGGAAGSVYAGVAFGGKETPTPTALTCTEEYNGVSWATANAMPHGLDTVGAGTQNAAAMAGGATVAPHTHGAYGTSDDTFEYNGTSWSSAPDMLTYMSQHTIAGGTGTLISGPGLGGWSNGIGAIFEPGFVTGSADTYNNFQPSANGDGRYLLTKKLQANHSPGCAGGGSTSCEEDFGGGY